MAQDKELIETALLVVRWQRGDRSAFEGIVKRWEKSLFYYLRRLAPSEPVAWELLQETWLKLVKSLKQVRDPRAFPAFLYRTARNTAISHLRRAEFSERDAGDDKECAEEGEKGMAQFDNAGAVHRGIGKVAVVAEGGVDFVFLRELSLEGMGVLLGVAVGTVKSRLFYAKQAMRRILEEGDNHG